jgi:tetratricopeptide (TPR) repeat protein
MVLGKKLGCPASALAISMLIFSAGAFCQQSDQNADTGSPSPNSQTQPNAAPDKKSSSEGNSFPTAQSEAAAKAASQEGQPSTPQSDAPKTGSSSSNRGKSPTSQNNPFPEAQSKAAAKGDGDSAQRSGGSSANGTAGENGSSGGYSSSDAQLPPTDLGQGDYKSHGKLDSFTRDQTQDGRIEDDLKVADLYMNSGNYRGAVLRYQDAIQFDPQNDAALYGIANAMCRENLTAEAMAHFKSYAKSNPQGKYAIKAEKMLSHPNKCTHNF